MNGSIGDCREFLYQPLQSSQNDRSNSHLQSYLDQRLSVVGEHKMIVRDSVADGIVGADDVNERSEERKGVTILGRREIRDPLVRFRVGVSNWK